MGGSGKTTLVQEVGTKAKESPVFDRVVLTTVSQNPSIKNIQGKIAEVLGIKFEEESEKGRASRIALRLQSGERILIILDDIWAKLNLEDIGIRFRGNHQTSFKVVMTTRRLDVCILMDCQRTIQLDLLEEEEAWTLFQTHTNVGEAAEVDVAHEIAMECKGLPIAIVAVGSCLKGKGIDEMKVILHRLRNARRINVDKGVTDAFTCLDLSYDYLATQEAKELLLLCAMFPEDHNINVEDLFRYGVGLDLCRDVNSFEIARSEVRTTINHLIDSSLLMRSPKLYQNKKEYVRMHDVVRDFAMWKASKENHAIMVNCTKELNDLIVDDAVKDCYAVSSWYDNQELLKFPFQLDAPKLEFLLLHSTKTLVISHASFEVAKQLKALIIIPQRRRIEDTFEILQLQPIQHLSNLRTLRLQRWDLCDISFVVSLTRLEILDLEGSKFERVPNGIAKLSKLKLLDLSKCQIEECCYKVIGMCSQLEELYVPNHFPHSKKGSCYEYLVGPMALKKLRRYNLEIGAYDGVLESQNGTRCLRLWQLNISTLGAIIKDLAQKATAIQFFGVEGGSRSFMSNIVQGAGGMAELEKLNLERCSKIECIVEETTLHKDTVIMPRLDELVLRDMDNLNQICRGHSPFSLFQKLERLSILNCPQLLHIFPTNCNLGNLKFLKISDCPKLQFLFPVSCTLLSLKELRIQGCSNLKHVFEGEGSGDAWENLRFPELKILSVYDCHKLEYICPVFFAQRFNKLQNLSITRAPEMKFLFGGVVGEEQPVHDHDKCQLVLPLLEDLNLINLPNLVGICSERYQTILPSIKTLEWKDCPNMELQELKGHQWRNEEYKQLAAVEQIKLDNCKAEFIFHYQTGVGEQHAKFQHLRHLTLSKCARLKFVFSTQICQNLSELTSLTISSCDELEAIFSGNEVGQKNLSITESCLVKLQSLEISECNKLKFILSFMISSAPTPILPQLSTLRVSDCSQMEEIFKCSNINGHDVNEGEITFPNMTYMRLENLPKLINMCQWFRFQTGEFCQVQVRDCPKFMPMMTTTIYWTKERITRRYKLKHNQLNNKEALNDLPLSVLIPGKIDSESPSVRHYWEVIGDDETNDLGMLGGPVAFQVMNFQYLYCLEVTQFQKLKFLFSMSTIVQNRLPKLDTIILSDCEELEVIFGHSSSEDDANYSETIVLSSLRMIKLKNLANLKSVCQTGLQIQVQLSDIIITNCPKFVDSSVGRALEQLGSILVSTEDSNVETSSNVNEDKLISRAKWLSLSDSMNLLYVWEGPTFITFQNLRKLSVIRCRRLKCMFPSTVMRSLPCLSTLWIEECEEMEEMMSSELGEECNQFPNEFSNSLLLCFPRLGQLRVKRCRKLKWLFPSLPSTQHLPLLEYLNIEECSELRGLFNSEIEIQEEEEAFYFNMLPNLRGLYIKDCPIFSETTLADLERLSQWNNRR